VKICKDSGLTINQSKVINGENLSFAKTLAAFAGERSRPELLRSRSIAVSSRQRCIDHDTERRCVLTSRGFPVHAR